MRTLVTGASGQLGAYLLRELRVASSLTCWSGTTAGELFGARMLPVDLADPDAIATAFRAAQPDIVLHAGAMARLADCHRDPARAWRVNARGTSVLAELVSAAKARLVMVSTDLVFDGEKGWYREEDPPGPLSEYGRTKAAAEDAVLAAGGVVVRVSLLFGPSLNGRPSFFTEQVDALLAGRPITLFADEWRTPLSLATAARALVELARSGFSGLLHLGGPERLSRLEMGRKLAEALNADPAVIHEARRDDLPSPEPRPRDTSLCSDRWRALIPSLPWPSYAEAVRW